MLEKLKKNVDSVLLDDKYVITEYIDSRLAELQEELVKAVGYQDRIDKIATINLFSARLLIRHASSGKMYLYDVLDIKKETSKSCQE